VASVAIQKRKMPSVRLVTRLLRRSNSKAVLPAPQ
jgi:hypothetical protein